MNIPNKLTLVRIFLIPFFIFFALTSFIPNSYMWSLIIFVVASFTDFLDGYIARKNDIVTDFGKLMDPLADKMLVVSALIIFASQGLINAIVVILIVARDFIINSIRLLAVNKGKVISADIWGKVKTVFQMVAIIVILIYKSFEDILLSSILQYVKVTGNVLIYMAVILTVISACNYIIKSYELWKANI